MHNPQERIVKGIRRKRIAWSLWALALILTAAGLFVKYDLYHEAMPPGHELREEISWNPLVESGTAREFYLQTRKIGYDADGRRIDQKTYICEA